MYKSFEIKGDWFLPTNKEKRISGVLKFNPGKSTRLELFGNFKNYFDIDSDDRFDFILGTTSKGELITLYKCYEVNPGTMTFNFKDSSAPMATYGVEYILIGDYIEKTEQLVFDKVICEIHNLDEWVGISGFTKKIDIKKLKNKEVLIEYKAPEQIKFEIEKGVIGNFIFSYITPSISRYQKEMSVRQTTQFSMDYLGAKTIDACLKYITTFKNFLSLGLYGATYFTSIKLLKKNKEISNDNIPPFKSLELFFKTYQVNDTPELKYNYKMLFNYVGITNSFPHIIRKWYSMYEKLEPALNLVFDQFYSNPIIIETFFLNLAQAAETFHARLHNHKKMSTVAYNQMKNDILAISDKKYHAWLNSQFNFGNHLNLHTRLEELLEKYSNILIDELIPDKDLFVKQVKHSRNYYTHYPKEVKSKVLVGVELLNLSKNLKALLVSAFLVEAGFSREEVGEMMKKVKHTYFRNWT